VVKSEYIISKCPTEGMTGVCEEVQSLMCVEDGYSTALKTSTAS
jgi:hypothetical protein